MIRKPSAIVVIGVLILFSTACSSTQSDLPTLMPPATIPAATDAPIFVTPDGNIDLNETPPAGVVATSEAISAPIQRELVGIAGVEVILSVSASAVDNGIVVYIEASMEAENDNETTMGRILEVVQAQAAAVTQIQVRTWVGTVLQRSWLWENGIWSAQ